MIDTFGGWMINIVGGVDDRYFGGWMIDTFGGWMTQYFWGVDDRYRGNLIPQGVTTQCECTHVLLY